jgi:mono/diheme cytochrome c family protein
MKSLAMASGAFFLLALSTSSQNRTQEDQRAVIDSLKGGDLYRAYCAVCHGSDAKGDGPMSKSLKTAPPDLTRIAARNAGSFPLARVRRIISGTEVLSAGHGTREMPVWGSIFSRVDADRDLGGVRIDNLARYLQSLQAK